MGRNCHGPKLTWADFVMGRNDPKPHKIAMVFPLTMLFLEYALQYSG